jgi:WXG100 family type VII secretion target
MPDGMYQASEAELKGLAQELVDGNTDLMAQLNKLAQSVEAVENQWQGAAATAFNKMAAAFMRDGKVLNEKLIDMAEQVTGTANAYVQQEEQASQSLSAIAATLDP